VHKWAERRGGQHGGRSCDLGRSSILGCCILEGWVWRLRAARGVLAQSHFCKGKIVWAQLGRDGRKFDRDKMCWHDHRPISRSSVKPRKAGGVLSRIFMHAQTRSGYSRRRPRSGSCRRFRVFGLPAIPSDHSWITDPRLVHHATGANESLRSKRWDGDARAHKETISSCSGTVIELGFAWNGSMAGWSSFTPTNTASRTSSCNPGT